MHVLVAEDDFANRAAGQTEEHDKLNERKATAFGLGSRLGETPLVGRAIGRRTDNGVASNYLTYF